MSPSLQVDGALSSAAARAGDRAAERLLSLLNPQGYWCFELTTGSAVESDAILLELWLHPPESGLWNPPHPERIRGAAESILARQLPDGGFGIYPGDPAEASATVKAYFALKVAGVPVGDPRLKRARDRVLALGGIQSANSLVKIDLSLFVLYPRQECPSAPPEMILLPGKFIYRISAQARAILVPLSIIQSFNPARPVPAGFTLQELFLREGTSRTRHGVVDRLLKFYERHPLGWLRRRAVAKCRDWMLERTRTSGGLGAISPSMLYSILALDLLGYPPERDGPGFPVVRDTAIAAFALGEWGHAPAAALSKCADWLLAKEVRRKGDWSVWRPHAEPSGWSFEAANEFYPNIEGTAMVLLALRHAQAACPRRALDWLLAMQSRDGGWAAFDVDNHWHPFSELPFAVDATCPGITGRVLEAISTAPGVGPGHPAVRRAVGYLLDHQEPDGSWRGRWEASYIYGTFLGLRGLRSAGVDDHEAPVLRAGEWLRSVQNSDGGWGESCAGYAQGSFSPARSTASQTACALSGLLAGGDSDSLGVRQGIECLVGTQQDDGGWPGEYGVAYPLLALAEYRKAAEARS